MESLAESFESEEDTVKLAVLTAAAQLFFKRPPEVKAVLGAVLCGGLQDSNQDVHDRALLYYRSGHRRGVVCMVGCILTAGGLH